MIERSRDVPTPLPCSLALELEMPGMEEIEGGNERQESSTLVLYIVGTNRTRIACGTVEKKRPSRHYDFRCSKYPFTFGGKSLK